MAAAGLGAGLRWGEAERRGGGSAVGASAHADKRNHGERTEAALSTSRRTGQTLPSPGTYRSSPSIPPRCFDRPIGPLGLGRPRSHLDVGDIDDALELADAIQEAPSE